MYTCMHIFTVVTHPINKATPANARRQPPASARLGLLPRSSASISGVITVVS